MNLLFLRLTLLLVDPSRTPPLRTDSSPLLTAGRCGAGRKPPQRPKGDPTLPRACGPPPPPPSSWRSCPRARQFSCRVASDPSLGRKDPGCSGHFRPKVALDRKSVV